jgi:transposase
MVHRARQLLVEQRTRLGTAIRAHLAEIGIVAAKGQAGLAPSWRCSAIPRISTRRG